MDLPKTTGVYRELRKGHEAELAAFPMFFAFSGDQFKAGLEKLGLKEEDKPKLFTFVDGGYAKLEDKAAFFAMLDRHMEDLKAAYNADKTGEGFIFDMFAFELANHEYIATGDFEPALIALGLDADDVNANPALVAGLELAKEYCRKGAE